MVTITKLKGADAKAHKEINTLLRQLSARNPTCSAQYLKQVLANRNLELWVIRDGKRIVGTGTVLWNSILTERFALIEDVVVDREYRGRGLGEKIMRKLIAVARGKKVHTIGLSSRPHRIAANKLYQKLGFIRKDTNVYKLRL